VESGTERCDVAERPSDRQSPSPRVIDPATWSRREAYDLFRGLGFPYLSVTADIDVTALRRIHRRRDFSFTVGLVYALAKAANEVPALRRRLRGDAVVEHGTVHPSITVLAAEEVFRFATLPYVPEFARFAADAAGRIERARTAKTLWQEPDRDDLLFMTTLPWVSFTALVHPVPLDPPDSVPRIAWGRFRAQGRRVLLPLNIQAHHALVDGVDVGRFFTRAEEISSSRDAFR
jgi:chloramphenicol O-acetyltransferase type A